MSISGTRMRPWSSCRTSIARSSCPICTMFGSLALAQSALAIETSASLNPGHPPEIEVGIAVDRHLAAEGGTRGARRQLLPIVCVVDRQDRRDRRDDQADDHSDNGENGGARYNDCPRHDHIALHSAAVLANAGILASHARVLGLRSTAEAFHGNAAAVLTVPQGAAHGTARATEARSVDRHRFASAAAEPRDPAGRWNCLDRRSRRLIGPRLPGTWNR